MIRLAMVLAGVVVLHAQDAEVKRGAELFRSTCAVTYCHGVDGGAGRAPRLAGTSLDARALTGLIAAGRPGTGMPGFGSQLKPEEIQAVARYILSLPRPTGESPVAVANAKLPAEANQGRALFFDAVRLGGCGRCHELADRGTPVGPNLRTSDAEHRRDLRAVPTTGVVTANPNDEEPFPAVVVERSAARVRVYDLSSPLPVLRTFAPSRIRITAGSWSHAAAAEGYSDAELAAIGAYLTSIR